MEREEGPRAVPFPSPRLPLKPWIYVALGSSLPHPPFPQPHLHLRQWPPGLPPLQGSQAAPVSSPSARSSPSVAKDGGAASQGSGLASQAILCLLLWAPQPLHTPLGKAGCW